MLDLLERGLYFSPDDSGGGDGAKSDEDTKDPGESEDKGDAEESAKDQKEEQEKDEFSGQSEDDLKAQLLKTRTALKKANDESKDRRLKLKKYEEEDNKRKKQEMTEVDRLKTEKEEVDKKAGILEKRLRTTLLRSVVINTANELNFRSSQDAYDLADLGDAIAIVNDGDDIIESEKPSADLVKTIKKSLADLAKSKPYLISTTKKPDIDSRNKSTGKEQDQDKLKRRFGID